MYCYYVPFIDYLEKTGSRHALSAPKRYKQEKYNKQA